MKIKNKLIIFILVIITFLQGGRFLNNINKDYSTTNDGKLEQNELLMRVNKKNELSSKYVPGDLVKSNIPFLNNTTNEEKHMQKEAAIAIEELFKVAKVEGITLIGSSAYRSYKSQVEIYNKYVLEKGIDYANNYVALPGKSEHQTGLSIDVTNESRCFDKTSIEAKWLANNAYRFGFILRYPEGKEDITGYNYEPWHIRYVGKDAATEIYSNGLTLEEYAAGI